ncbi:hypothetical protein GPJ56_004919 [Histomonas meleagridis]|uniref:uncharacterized protein n=1 Tax=Histomonas meleagridis TaxID=135588 RepID=UPI00355A0D78|nr:hypothetical protein GPJ56_004919 [Histomonas meleagridis]KAH0798555.1 hypothetical protein GO595_008420 [Histomonas meleagridis]
MNQILTNCSSDLSLTFNTLDRFTENLNHSIKLQKNRIEEMLNRIDAIISSRHEEEIELPKIEEIHQLVDDFYNEKLPIVPSPYQPLCGSMRFPTDQIIPSKTFACVQQEKEYILALILSYDPNKNTYLVCDADPELNEILTFTVPSNKVIPLPTSSPARRTKHTTYSLRTKVLALWLEEVGGWTSVFYKASVVSQPSTTDGYYVLKFDGNPPQNAVIPEKFIVYNPEYSS